MWDCFSYNVSVTTHWSMKLQDVQWYTSRRKVKRKGASIYLQLIGVQETLMN